MGREKYLKDLINSIILSGEYPSEHHIVFQGCGAFDDLKNYMQTIPNIIPHFLPENLGAGGGNNYIIPKLNQNNLWVKLDDDAKIVSRDFFKNAQIVHSMFPNSVFSAYPVGLINNPGGVRSNQHDVHYHRDSDQYFTRRIVSRVGGFCRFWTSKIQGGFIFPNDLDKSGKTSGAEDVNFGNYCNSKQIETFYLENCMIVEHNESSLGQHERYKEYFGERF
jgi:hypothetical protein